MSVQQSFIRNASLKHLNSFGLELKADYLFELEQVQQLPALFEWVKAKQLSWLIIGSGSNLLLTEDFKGLVILNRLRGVQVEDNAQAIQLTVAAGEDWQHLVQWTISQGLPGLENLALIPGTAGAAPVQNIGAYGLEFADCCHAVSYFSFDDFSVQRLTAAECEFGYRDSIFKRRLKNQGLITEVELSLAKAWRASIHYAGLDRLAPSASAQQVFDTVCQLRKAKLPNPTLLGNAGSFFKNPVIAQEQVDSLVNQYPKLVHYPAAGGQRKLAAGWLIDHLGLKGYRIGDAAVHQEQALVLVNHGHASAAQLLSLCQYIRNQVWQAFGIVLEPEVRFIGADGEVAPDSVLGRPNE
ncbi:UDP-N-acetylmuramate dehydrogenase [Agarivorans sp. QJM3NY_33]|uniref:UDP-N-acetylmuramate dehydrogenase n=1 Tax=Agarivorans sp. QJM3NY_33 TaxID=3421432 RepID=UPI003D7E1741